MGLGQAYDSKHFNDCIRQGADHPSTRAGWPMACASIECRELRFLKHFVDVLCFVLFSICCICVCIVLSIAGG